MYTSEKNLNLNTIDKIHLKCDVIDGSVMNRIREPILFGFNSHKLPGYKVFCEPETTHYKKINKSAPNTIPFYSEDVNNKEVIFKGETLTVTLQMTKI